MAFFKHAIMIGGTGMLSEMSKWVMQQATYTVIIGRNEHRLRRLQSDYGSVHVKQLDYKDTHALRQMIQTAIVQHGAIDLVVAWIHSDAPYAISTIIHEICHLQRKKWRFFHIKGSSQHLDRKQSLPCLSDDCLYREVHLGFKREGGRSRWLTHDEISTGVIDAIQNDRKKTVIGMLEPWEQRPI